MKDDSGKLWTMHDPDVYNACLPALRLASRFMSHAQNHEWYVMDARKYSLFSVLWR